MLPMAVVMAGVPQGATTAAAPAQDPGALATVQRQER
jgi:hypothetical protein